MADFSSEFKNQQKILKPKVILLMKRIYVIAFNIYAWFWLFREIFIRHSTEWESYLLWLFTALGMHYFVLDSKDILIKIPGKNQKSEK